MGTPLPRSELTPRSLQASPCFSVQARSHSLRASARRGGSSQDASRPTSKHAAPSPLSQRASSARSSRFVFGLATNVVAPLAGPSAANAGSGVSSDEEATPARKKTAAATAPTNNPTRLLVAMLQGGGLWTSESRWLLILGLSGAIRIALSIDAFALACSPTALCAFDTAASAFGLAHWTWSAAASVRWSSARDCW